MHLQPVKQKEREAKKTKKKFRYLLNKLFRDCEHRIIKIRYEIYSI